MVVYREAARKLFARAQAVLWLMWVRLSPLRYEGYLFSLIRSWLIPVVTHEKNPVLTGTLDVTVQFINVCLHVGHS